MQMRTITWKTAIGGATFSLLLLLSACGGGGGGGAPSTETPPPSTDAEVRAMAQRSLDIAMETLNNVQPTTPEERALSEAIEDLRAAIADSQTTIDQLQESIKQLEERLEQLQERLAEPPPPPPPPEVEQPVVIVPQAIGAVLSFMAQVSTSVGVTVQSVSIPAAMVESILGAQTITLNDQNSRPMMYVRDFTEATTITQADGSQVVLPPQIITIGTGVVLETEFMTISVDSEDDVPAGHPMSLRVAMTVLASLSISIGVPPPSGILVDFEPEGGTVTITLTNAPSPYIPASVPDSSRTTNTLREVVNTTINGGVLTATMTMTITETQAPTALVDGVQTITLAENSPGPGPVNAAFPGGALSFSDGAKAIAQAVTVVTTTVTLNLNGGNAPVIATLSVYHFWAATVTVAKVPQYENYLLVTTATTTVTMTTYSSTMTVVETTTNTIMTGTPIMTNYMRGTVAYYNNGFFAFAELPPPNPSDGVNYRTPEFGGRFVNGKYGLDRINADAAYQRGYWGQGATVAIIDTGIRLSHNEFRNSGRIVNSRDFLTGRPGIQDAHGHGTFIAGIIGGARDGQGIHGVAPSVSMIPIRIGGAARDDLSFDVSHEQAAFNFALNNGAHILNNSYGLVPITLLGTYQSQERLVEMPYFGPLIQFSWQFNRMRSVTRTVEDADVVLVWAAGNEGWQSGGSVLLYNTQRTPVSVVSISDLVAGFTAQSLLQNGDGRYLGGLSGLLSTIRITVPNTGAVLGIPETGSDFYSLFPHYYPQLTDRWLAVVATNDNENSPLWSGSNGCGDAKFWCIAAPGQNIYSADIDHNSDYRYWNGTSFAAPHVSGALAVLKSRLPDMPMAVVRALLLFSAEDLAPGGERVDDNYGWGLVNLERAVTMQGSVRLADSFALSSAISLPPPNPSDGTNYRINNEFNRNYGLGRINADAAYQRGYWGQGVTVGVLDTGMLTSHVDLRDNIVAGYNFFADNGEITEPIGSYNPDGHGTAVGGVIAAVRNTLAGSAQGVAPQAKLMPLQLADNYGRFVGDSTAAIRHAIDNNVKIVNNSWGRFLGRVGTYNGQRYHVRIPDFNFPGGENYNAIAAEVRGKDAVLVWAAGNGGWNSENSQIILCDELKRAFTGTGCGTEVRVSQQDFRNGFDFEEFNATYTYTLTSGIPGASPTVITETYSTPSGGSKLSDTFPGNITGPHARLPVAHPELTDRWLVAVATDENDKITDFSNGCGDTKFWCLAAPGINISTTSGADNNRYEDYDGTSFAAPHVSGALAILKSRLPNMPMSVVRALLLRTADDLGAEGVDDVYGWGLVDLQKAVTVQGNVELAVDKEPQSGGGIGTGTGNGVRLMDARIDLPESFAALRGRLSEISVAVSVFGNAHYNTALESIAQVSSTSATLGAAAADMLLPDNDNRFSAGIFFAATDESEFRYAGLDAALPFAGEWRLRHDFCGEECEESVWKEWNAFADGEGGTPFFAEGRESFMLEKRGEGLRPFASFSGEVHGEDRLQYRQFGLRWTGGGEGLSFSAELSEIREGDSFLGASFGELGDTSAKTHQGRLLLRGGIGGGWEGFAFYERARGEVEVSGGEFLQDISDLQAWGWKAGLQRSHLLTGGDKFRFSFGRKTTVRRGEAALRYSRAVCSDGTAGDCFSEAAFGDVKGAPEIYTKREQEVRLENRELDLSSISDLILSAGYSSRVLSDGEFSLGLEYNTATHKSAISAQLQIQF